MNNINKEKIIGDIIGLNPTGTIEFNGTFQMNGNNNIIQTPINASKERLEKSQNNQIVCENFNNQYSEFHKYLTQKEYYIVNIDKIENNFNKKYILLLIVFSIIFIIYLLL